MTTLNLILKTIVEGSVNFVAMLVTLFAISLFAFGKKSDDGIDVMQCTRSWYSKLLKTNNEFIKSI